MLCSRPLISHDCRPCPKKFCVHFFVVPNVTFVLCQSDPDGVTCFSYTSDNVDTVFCVCIYFLGDRKFSFGSSVFDKLSFSVVC